jgi:hypothetical protein
MRSYARAFQEMRASAYAFDITSLKASTRTIRMPAGTTRSASAPAMTNVTRIEMNTSDLSHPLVTALIQAVKAERDEFNERDDASYSTEAVLLQKERVRLCTNALVAALRAAHEPKALCSHGFAPRDCMIEECPHYASAAGSEPSSCAACGRPFWNHDRVKDPKPGERSLKCIGTAQPPPAAPHSGDHLQRFTEWLVKEMPAGTIIGDPAWWARKLLAAACVFADELPAQPSKPDPIGFVARKGSTIVRDFALPSERHELADGYEWMPVYDRPAQPPSPAQPDEALARSHLRGLVYHWYEFGPGDGMAEKMHYADEYLKSHDSATQTKPAALPEFWYCEHGSPHTEHVAVALCGCKRPENQTKSEAQP